MNILRVVIIDDDDDFLLFIKKIVEDYLSYHVVGSASSYEKGLELVNSMIPDLVISDINLGPGKTGIDIASNCFDKNIPFIFISSYDDADLYTESKRILHHSYLIKPFHKFTLASAIDNLIRLSEKKEKKSPILVNTGSETSLIGIHDIKWIESERNYTTIYTKEKKLVVRNSLIKVMAAFDKNKILRVHKSYAVTVECIKSINFSRNVIYIEGKEIPIGRSFKSKIKDQLKYLFKDVD